MVVRSKCLRKGTQKDWKQRKLHFYNIYKTESLIIYKHQKKRLNAPNNINETEE